MKRGKEIDKWYPFYIDKWLFGSTRHELIIRPGWAERWPKIAPLIPASILEQPYVDLRGIFADLMTLSKKDDGYIRANETTPYPLEQLAGTFYVPIEHLKATITICLHGDVAKIEERGAGIYYIKTTENYGFTDRYKRKVSKQMRECSGKTEQGSGKAAPILNDIIKNNIILEWNRFATKNGLVQIQGVKTKSTRESYLRARMGEEGFVFSKLLEAVGKSPFLLGLTHKEDKEPFLATFDWILRPSNYTKIIEGNYIGKSTRTREACQYVAPTVVDQDAEKKLRSEYEERLKAFMKERGYETEEEIPIDIETFSEFKKRMAKEGR
jgi:hypothetical protein